MKPLKNSLLLVVAVLMATAMSLVLGAPALAVAGGLCLVAKTAPAVGSLLPQLPAHALHLNLPNILWGDGDDNMGGIRTIAYYCLHSEVARGGHAAPIARASATTLADLATLATDHTFKAGKGWKRFYCTEDAGMIDNGMQGEKDGRSWLNKIKLTHPGAKAEAIGFLRWIQNAGTYWIVQDAEGQNRMLGSEFYPAKVDTASITTTETAAGRKAITFEVACSSPYPSPIFTGNPAIEDDDSDY